MIEEPEFEIDFAGMTFTAEEFKEMCAWYIDKYVEDSKYAK